MQKLENPPPPTLGYPTEVYERRHFNENNSSLTIFFRKLNGVLGALFGPSGGKYLNIPHGAFHDETDQVATSTTTANTVVFSNTDISNGVTLVDNTKFTVAVDGVWNLQFSMQVKNVSNDGQDFDVWFRKNGTNIAQSNSRFHIPPRKSSGAASHLIASLNFLVELSGGEYVEIVGSTTSTDVSLEAFGTSTSPTRPAVPSVIATMTFVSNLPG
jgi:hypothetical protein